MDLDELRSSIASALRTKTLAIVGGEVAEVDGVEIYLSHLPDPAENFAFVVREPKDAVAALDAVEDHLGTIGMPFGIGVIRARHPSVEAALRARGNRVLFDTPLMTAPSAELSAAMPEDVEIGSASPADVDALAQVDALAFDSDLEVSRGMYTPELLRVARVVTARSEGSILGIATGVPTGGAVAVFGVAVVPDARGRGIGSALARAAARAGGPDAIAWLQARGDAWRLYERLGFREVGRIEIWVR